MTAYRNDWGASPTRRMFLLRSTAFCFSVGMPGLALARAYGSGAGVPWAPGAANPPRVEHAGAEFLTEVEHRAVEAITARLIPSDGEGPGAREANVTTFIDRQLAGFYGRGERWYMHGPFPAEPLATQGYQAPYTPAALWRAGLAALDTHCRGAHDGRGFADLAQGAQDAVLKGLEDGTITLNAVPATTFFKFMLDMTVEGYFCDPLYGGNRDMIAWSFIGFPGARYDYRDYVNHNGRRIEIAPVGLSGRPGWTARGDR